MRYSFCILFYIISISPSQLCAQESLDSSWQKAEDFYQEGIVAFSSNMDSAIVLLNVALPLYQQSKVWVDYVKCLNGLAFIFYHKKDFVQYQYFNEIAVSTAHKYLPPDNPYAIQAINNLHAYYYTIGDFDQAIKLMKEVILAAEKASIDTGEYYHNLANSYRAKGDYLRAFEYFEKTLLIQRESSKNNLVPTIYQGIAWVYQEKEEIDSAIFYINKSLAALQKAVTKNTLNEDNTIENLLKLSELWCLKENTRKAKSYLQQVLQFDLKEKQFERVHRFERLGQIYLIDKNYAQALDAYATAQEIAVKQDRRSRPPFVARRYLEMGKIYTLMDRGQEALTRYQEALQVLSPGFNSSRFFDNPPVKELLSQQDALKILEQKATVLWMLYQQKKEGHYLEASVQTYFTACELIREIRQGISSAEAKNILSEKSISVYEGAIRSALAIYQKTRETNFLEKAFLLAESNKALLLLESLNDQVAKGLAGIPDSLLKQENSIKLKLAYLQKTLLEKKNEGLADKNMEVQIFSSKQKLERLIARFEKEYPRYFEAKYQNEPIALSSLQTDLARAGEILLEYYVGEEAIYLFVLDGERVHAFELENRDEILASTNRLQGVVNQLPGEEDGLKDYQQFLTDAHNLYTQLIAPGQEFLKASASLIFIPDHLLNYVPFELLLLERPEGPNAGFSLSKLKYLLEEYAISYDYSATLYANNKGSKKTTFDRDFIGFAPAFKELDYYASNRACDAEELYNLQCSNQEVNSISNLLNGQGILQKMATKEAFEKQALGSRIIHLATHACVDEQYPELNKIHLTDDYLTNADLYNLELDAELAVLSACNTGSGKLIKGEGVMSLARGFITAGCTSTVVSRWSVNDCATSEIMLLFYQGLQRGLPKNEALRQAKINFLNTVDKTKTHPYYWAAFVQFGNVEAMDFESGTWKYIGLLLSLLILIALGYRSWKMKY